MSAGEWDAVEMFGRLHPLLVHVPIGLLLLLVVLEVAARGERRVRAAFARRVTLVVSAGGAVFASLFGWMLSLGGGYEGELVVWHQCAGFATAAVAVALLILDRWRSAVAYRACLGVGCLAMGIASHLGGSLTHGEKYLTEHLPPALKALFGIEGGASAGGDAFSVAVRPILESRCMDCHREGKSKGKLRMDIIGGLFSGGTEGPAIVPGNSATSLIIKRITLPEGHDDRMPPEGRDGPTDAEIAVLQWWIDAGAPTNQTIAQLDPPSEVARAIAERAAATQAKPVVEAKAQPALSAADAEAAAKRLSEELGIIILPLARGEPWLEANASLAGTNFGDEQLMKLASIGPNLRRLDLTGTGISDAGLAGVSAFPNLESLHVPRTRISDDGLKHLSSLGQLESLNLYGTAVSDSGIGALEGLPLLRRLYLWQTKVSAKAADQLAARLPAASETATYKRQIEELQAKIRGVRVEVNTGGPEIAAKPEQAKPSPAKADGGKSAPGKAAGEKGPAGKPPINATCPVKDGKPVNPAITVEHEGKVIGFCCEGCKAAFLKDPKAYLSKIGE